jgi:hypothetical protein
LHHFKRWRLALEEAWKKSVRMAKRMGKLEARVNSQGERPRGSSHASGASRETIGRKIQKEDDGIDEQVEAPSKLESQQRYLLKSLADERM